MFFELLLRDYDPRFIVWRLKIDIQSSLESRRKTIGDILQFTDRAVAGKHHLLLCLIEVVEGVKEFFLVNPCLEESEYHRSTEHRHF